MSLTLARQTDQANIRASEGAGTTTLEAKDTRQQIFNLSAARTCVLPSTDIKIGDVFYITNQSVNILTVQSSTLNTIQSFAYDQVAFIALQDSPTSSSHWSSIFTGIEDTQTTSINFVFNGSGGSSSGSSVITHRNGKIVNLVIEGNATATTGTSSTTFTANAAIPVNMRPPATVSVPCFTRQGGSALTTVGFAQVSTGGIITIFKDIAGTAWTNASGDSGLQSGLWITYRVA